MAKTWKLSPGGVLTGITGISAASGTIAHPDLGAVRYSLEQLPDDMEGQVAHTIGLMRSYALEDAVSPAIQADLYAALGEKASALPQQDVAARVFDYVKRRIRFVQDERLASPWLVEGTDVIEVLVRPIDLSMQTAPRVGDCDDFSTYAASLLTAAAVDNSFVTVAADASAPGQFSHVYVAAYPDGVRLPLDTSHGDYAGWETMNYSRRKEWPVLGNWMGEGQSGNPVVLLVLGIVAFAHFIRNRKGVVRW